MHGWWTLPFILIGIGLLLFRRKDQDLILLGWLISLYLVLHADVIGKGPFVHRSLAASAHIFAPLAAIGCMTAYTLVAEQFKLDEEAKKNGKWGAIAVFVILVVIFNVMPGIALIKQTPTTTLNGEQIAVANWIHDNTPSDASLSNAGTLSLAQKRWIQYLSQRHFVGTNLEQLDAGIQPSYALLDYTNFRQYGMQ